jgi:DNA (cytosine-5)-methyltransferase 1
MRKLKNEGRQPPIIALENVPGLLTSRNGEDLKKIINALTSEGYRIGGIVIDAALFVAQSRPRLFLVAVAKGVVLPKGLMGRVPNPNWHPTALQDVVETLEPEIRKNWIWWKLPEPKEEAPHLVDILEHNPKDVTWHTAEQTKQLLQMMSPGNLAKVNDAKSTGEIKVGTVYRRTREGVQRAEVRFDGVSGCLRTPSGGSSRQIVMIVEGGQVHTRLISARETARLMGLPEWYVLPQRYNDAYYLTGDGVVVPVVSWIEQHILRPLALSARRSPTVGTQASLELVSV